VSAGARGRLLALYVDAQRIGLLGPGPVDQHLDQALAFGAAVPHVPVRFADLGSGAGIPGLVLAALVWPDARAILVESQARRIQHLRRAVEVLGIGDRVEVYPGRAEDAGRREHRETCDVVVARAFGPPAVVAECAVALLGPAGSLYVSEPPATNADRWPAARLAELGFAPAQILLGAAVPDDEGAEHLVRVAHLRRTGPLADRWPRTASALQKRPLWRA
jgi:16S rRNA (guanine527-N7)-methyltransferase